MANEADSGKWWSSRWVNLATIVAAAAAVVMAFVALVQACDAREVAKTERADRAEQRLTEVILRAEERIDRAPELKPAVDRARTRLNTGRKQDPDDAARVFNDARSQLGDECEQFGFTCEVDAGG